jgi:hypothetical protein
MREFDTWTVIPDFPDYEINQEGDVRNKESQDEVGMIYLFDTSCYDLIKDGVVHTKTQDGLIQSANPRAKGWQKVPVKDSK